MSQSDSQRVPLPSRASIKAHAYRLMHERGLSLAHCLNEACRHMGMPDYERFLEAQRTGLRFLDELVQHQPQQRPVELENKAPRVVAPNDGRYSAPSAA